MTKEKILKASYVLFSQKGFASTSITDIVKKSGLTKGALYHYFPSKDELFIQVLLFIHEHYALNDIFALSHVTKSQYKKCLLNVGYKIIDLYQKDKYFSNFLWEMHAQIKKNPKIRKRVQQESQLQKEIFHEYIQKGIELGVFGAKPDIEYIGFKLKAALDSICLHLHVQLSCLDMKTMWEKVVNEVLSK
ncbi:MAG: TetR/AcrR family transcriptional regulator [Candidatus Woesearchaeota archaeon]